MYKRAVAVDERLLPQFITKWASMYLHSDWPMMSRSVIQWSQTTHKHANMQAHLLWPFFTLGHSCLWIRQVILKDSNLGSWIFCRLLDSPWKNSNRWKAGLRKMSESLNLPIIFRIRFGERFFLPAVTGLIDLKQFHRKLECRWILAWMLHHGSVLWIFSWGPAAFEDEEVSLSLTSVDTWYCCWLT